MLLGVSCANPAGAKRKAINVKMKCKVCSSRAPMIVLTLQVRRYAA
jgi:hypothetical protein